MHQLSTHLTEENHEEVLDRAKHKTMRQIEHLIAEIAPKPNVPSRIVTLPIRNQTKVTEKGQGNDTVARTKPSGQVTPLAPRRYKMEVTLDQKMRDKLTELQELMSHQIPDGDPAQIVGRALDVLLGKMRKQKAALTDKPRRRSGKSQTRAIPASIRRTVFKRDEEQCTYVDGDGNRCGARRFIEFHHYIPLAVDAGDEDWCRAVFTAIGALTMNEQLGDGHTVDISDIVEAEEPVIVALKLFSSMAVDDENCGIYQVLPTGAP